MSGSWAGNFLCWRSVLKIRDLARHITLGKKLCMFVCLEKLITIRVYVAFLSFYSRRSKVSQMVHYEPSFTSYTKYWNALTYAGPTGAVFQVSYHVSILVFLYIFFFIFFMSCIVCLSWIFSIIWKKRSWIFSLKLIGFYF